ncbi:MAG: response regulator [Chloroflexi bacterium]|nr:response regulator [Chloroflexota bacterium]
MCGSVLVVDDDAEVRELLCCMLNLNGFNSFAAKDGSEALQKVKLTPPDVVVLDVMMPEMDGIAVCETLRSQEETADLPIIMLSGKLYFGAVQAGLHAGANKYLIKPTGLNELIENIHDVLGHQLVN